MKGGFPLEATILVKRENFLLDQAPIAQMLWINGLAEKIKVLQQLRFFSNANGGVFYEHHWGVPLNVHLSALQSKEDFKFTFGFTAWTMDGKRTVGCESYGTLEPMLNKLDLISQRVCKGRYQCPTCNHIKTYHEMTSWGYAGWVCQDCYDTNPSHYPAPDTRGD